ncbi:hypothetical protein KEM55_006902, partial [Ascosphaera atra]
MTPDEEKLARAHMRLRQLQEEEENHFLARKNAEVSRFFKERDCTINKEKPPSFFEGWKPSVIDYCQCSSKNVRLARRYLKSIGLDPALAGEWGLTQFGAKYDVGSSDDDQTQVESEDDLFGESRNPFAGCAVRKPLGEPEDTLAVSPRKKKKAKVNAA